MEFNYFLNYKTTLEYLAYLGFELDSTKAIKITKPRKVRQKHGKLLRSSINDRNIFNCFIVGAPKAGKTSLLETFYIILIVNFTPLQFNQDWLLKILN